MTAQTTIDATRVLRHAPPFRFIGECHLETDRQLTAAVPETAPATAWAAPLTRSVLPVEYAAQAMGVLIRHRLSAPGMSGVLAGINDFAWDCAAAPLSHVTVRHMGSRGQFHDFKAHLFGRDGYVCARVSGFIHLSPAAPETAPGSDRAVDPQHGPDVPLFDLLDRTEEPDGCCLQLRASPACPVYAGHFPGAPITPGVLIAEEMVRAATTDPELALAALSDLTFKAPLLPGDTVELSLKRRSDIGFSASVRRGTKRLARAKFALVRLPATRTTPNPYFQAA